VEEKLERETAEILNKNEIKVLKMKMNEVLSS